MKHIRSLILALALSAGLAPAFAQAPPPVPALPDTERRTSYVISNSTCACAVGFQLFQDSTDVANWIEVWINGVLIPQSGNWNITSPTGSLATIPRPITNAVLTFTAARTGTVQIVGAQRPRRTSQFSESRGVAARDMNQVLSSLTAMLRENWDKTNDVTGRAVLAPPGETLALLPTAANRLNQGACFDANSNLTTCVSVPSSTFIAGNGIQFTGVGPTTISTQTYAAGNGITFTGSNPTVISAASSASNAAILLPTRAAAAALNLSAYGVVRTGGYATPGDGGGATFKNVGAAPFIDSYITSFTITGGSGYTNGSYYGAIFVNGTKPFTIGTITISGNALTGVDISYTPGNQCAVGDVLPLPSSAYNGYTSTPLGGSGASITVTGCSTPLASFTDSAGNRWQFVPEGLAPTVKQFGAVGDWNGNDASATDNYSAVQAALWFATFKSSTSFDAGGFWGGRVDLPQGSYKICGTGLKSLIIPQGVGLYGASGSGATLQFCSAWDASTIQVELGDPNWHFACFNIKLTSLILRNSSGTAYPVHSNCAQDFSGLFDTYIYSNGASARACLHYEKGAGGASTFTVRDLSCNANSASAMVKIGNTIASGLNVGSTMVELTNIVMGGSSAASPPWQTGPGIHIQGGFVNVDRFHFESMPEGVRVDVGVTGNGEHVTIRNGNGGSGVVGNPCTGIITLTGINIPGNTTISQIQSAGSCTGGVVVNNGQSGGSNYTSAIGQPAIFNPNFHSF